MEKDKRTNSKSQITTQIKKKDNEKQTQLITESEIRCSGRVNNFCPLLVLPVVLTSENSMTNRFRF